MGIFKITADDLQWIGGAVDDPQDLCLHGHVTVQIGDTFLEDHGTVSATALSLLKTLTEDKTISDYDIQMIPCCGNTLLANDDLTEVTIIGCDTGTNWSTIHEGDFVRLILPSGQEEVVSLSAYRNEVLRFADKVERFYNACTPKEIPKNEFERNGYIAFWNEWHRRYNEAALTDALATGREVELSHNGLHYFISHNSGEWSLYCEETKEIQAFDSADILYRSSRFDKELLRDELTTLTIDCIL